MFHHIITSIDVDESGGEWAAGQGPRRIKSWPQTSNQPSALSSSFSYTADGKVHLSPMANTNEFWLTYQLASRAHLPATTQLIELEFQNRKLVDLEDVLDHGRLERSPGAAH